MLLNAMHSLQYIFKSGQKRIAKSYILSGICNFGSINMSGGCRSQAINVFYIWPATSRGCGSAPERWPWTSLPATCTDPPSSRSSTVLKHPPQTEGWKKNNSIKSLFCLMIVTSVLAHFLTR